MTFSRTAPEPPSTKTPSGTCCLSAEAGRLRIGTSNEDERMAALRGRRSRSARIRGVIWELAGGSSVEGDRDLLEPQRAQHAGEHGDGVLLSLGAERALPRGGLDLLLRQDVDLLLAVRVAGAEVPDPVQQPLLL